MKNKLFILAYALFGAYLTTSSFIINKSGNLLEDPKIIFIVSFSVFFILSLILQLFFVYFKRYKFQEKPAKITSIFMIGLVLLLLVNLTILSNNIYNKGDIYDVSRLTKLSKLNDLINYFSIIIIFFVFLFLDYKINGKRYALANLKVVFLVLFMLIILVPLSILLDNFIRIIGFAIGLAGGL